MDPHANPSALTTRFGFESNQPIINVNSKYGRLYFSVFAVKALALDQGYFKILYHDGRWLVTKNATVNDFAMKFHMGAHYVVCKSLVIRLMNYFQNDKLSFLIEGLNRKRKYYALKFFVPDPASARPPRKPRSPDEIRKDPTLTSAEKIIARFEQTNFPGRVKTREILKAEHIANRT